MTPIPIKDPDLTEVVYFPQMHENDLRTHLANVGTRIAEAIDRRAAVVPAPVAPAATPSKWQRAQLISAVLLSVFAILGIFWKGGSYIISSELSKALEQPKNDLARLRDKDIGDLRKDFDYLRRDVDAVMVGKVFSPKSSGKKTVAVSTEEINRAAVRALSSRMNVDPSVIRTVSLPLFANPNKENWEATTALLNLRSFVNSTLPPEKRDVVYITKPGDANVWHQSKPGQWVEVQDLRLVLDAADDEAYPHFRDGGGHPVIGYERVIFKNCHIRYHGKPITLIDVFFENCTFEIQNDQNGMMLAKKILGDSPTTSLTLSD